MKKSDFEVAGLIFDEQLEKISPIVSKFLYRILVGIFTVNARKSNRAFYVNYINWLVCWAVCRFSPDAKSLEKPKFFLVQCMLVIKSYFGLNCDGVHIWAIPLNSLV